MSSPAFWRSPRVIWSSGTPEFCSRHSFVANWTLYEVVPFPEVALSRVDKNACWIELPMFSLDEFDPPPQAPRTVAPPGRRSSSAAIWPYATSRRSSPVIGAYALGRLLGVSGLAESECGLVLPGSCSIRAMHSGCSLCAVASASIDASRWNIEELFTNSSPCSSVARPAFERTPA